MSKKDGKEHPDPKQLMAKAMSHPLRATLLPMVRDQERSPTELADELGVDLNKLAYHVRQLERLGCIELVRTRPRRGATEHFYRATSQSLLVGSAHPPDDGRRVIREELLLDDKGQQEIDALLEKTPIELAKIKARARARLRSPNRGLRTRLEMLHVQLPDPVS